MPKKRSQEKGRKAAVHLWTNKSQKRHPKRLVKIGGNLGAPWDRHVSAAVNYRRIGLASSSGAAVAAAVVAAVAAEEEEATTREMTVEDQQQQQQQQQMPDARTAVKKAGSSWLVKGKRPPKELTFEQQCYWSQLIARYGTDYARMQRDHKLNYEQHAAARCKKMCEFYVESCAAPILPSAVVGGSAGVAPASAETAE